MLARFTQITIFLNKLRAKASLCVIDCQFANLRSHLNIFFKSNYSSFIDSHKIISTKLISEGQKSLAKIEAQELEKSINSLQTSVSVAGKSKNANIL